MPQGVSNLARLLIADDQPDVLEALRLLIPRERFALTLVTSPAALVEQLPKGTWDAILMDLNYSRGTTSGDEGLDLLSRIRSERPNIPIVVMTAFGDIDLAVRAMRGGAQSFVQKPWDNQSLLQILDREVAAGRQAKEKTELHTRERNDALLIQRALMPASLPETDAFRIAGAWQPAGTLGGDCYDVFTFAPNVMGLSIADVAGKGLPAALLMSSLQATVRAFALGASAPRDVSTSVNRLLCGQMIPGRFATFAYVHLDADRKQITYVNAGHNPPLLARPDGRVERLQATGTVLGVFSDASYDQAAMTLDPGDRLLLYTDGITEARDRHDEEFGEERLSALLAQHRHLDAANLHAALMKEITQFASAGFQDDATLLVVEVR